MAMKASNISKGMVILFKGEPHKVLEKAFFNLGRGMGHTQAKLRNVKNANVLRYTFKSEEPVEEVDIFVKKLQFLYHDENGANFMDPGTFEQTEIPLGMVSEFIHFLKEGDQYQVSFYEDKPIGIIPPQKVILKVVEAEDAVKGDTVTAAQKMVQLETGHSIKVPLFVKEGDSLIINTQTGEYVSRA